MPDSMFPVMGQGIAHLASDEDIKRDEIGFTNPNLHQRVDIIQETDEAKPKSYMLMVQSTDYFRAVETFPKTAIDESLEIP